MPQRPTGPAPETFYDRAYDLIRQIPRGKVMTYGHVALTLGAPSAARAVGYALSVLPPGTADVPWWRVINARGEISLKNRGAAADLQRQLLEREGVVFDVAGKTDLWTYRWWPE
ncbi:MAG: MGMT family protein [Chloroflexi bacterium]|nr:MGMT family protein [Chloroflexota bacterium]